MEKSKFETYNTKLDGEPTQKKKRNILLSDEKKEETGCSKVLEKTIANDSIKDDVNSKNSRVALIKAESQKKVDTCEEVEELCYNEDFAWEYGTSSSDSSNDTNVQVVPEASDKEIKSLKINFDKIFRSAKDMLPKM